MEKPKREKRGGRKKGTPNKRTQELERRAREGGLMPLDYVLAVMRDEANETKVRLEAAESALPFLHARRAAEDKHGNVPAMIYMHPPLEKEED